MEEVEDADPGSAARVGWLNRLIGRNGDRLPIEAIQFGGARCRRRRWPGRCPLAPPTSTR